MVRQAGLRQSVALRPARIRLSRDPRYAWMRSGGHIRHSAVTAQPRPTTSLIEGSGPQALKEAVYAVLRLLEATFGFLPPWPRPAATARLERVAA